MRLSEYTDYSLRVLMVCAAAPERSWTVAEIAEHFGISRNHLMKVVHDAATRGWLQTTRGRGGGIRLAADPKQLTVGHVVRACESDFRLAECFDAARDSCRLSPGCRLQGVFAHALREWFRVLDGATLSDVVRGTVFPAAPAGEATARVVLPR